MNFEISVSSEYNIKSDFYFVFEIRGHYRNRTKSNYRVVISFGTSTFKIFGASGRVAAGHDVASVGSNLDISC